LVVQNSGEVQNPSPDCTEPSEVNNEPPLSADHVQAPLPTQVTVKVEHVRKRRALDLFSGTGSVRKVLEAEGWEVVSLDVNPRWGANIIEDVLTWDYRRLPPKSFELITASTPCMEFSRALTTRGGQRVNKTDRRMDHADKVVCKVLEMIDYFQPKWWWIENPATGLLKERPYMAELAFVDLDYCQFSDWGYRKPTRFWGKFPAVGVKSVVCDGYHCPNLVGKPGRVGGKRRHRVQLSGWRSSPSTVQQYRIPPALVKYLIGSGTNSQGPQCCKAPPLPPSVPIHVASDTTSIGACGGKQLVVRFKPWTKLAMLTGSTRCTSQLVVIIPVSWGKLADVYPALEPTDGHWGTVGRRG